MQRKRKISDIMIKVEKLTAVRAIRGGLANLIPVLIIGAFALILNTFPVKAYQTFINGFAGGFLPALFEMVNKATFGVLSVYMSLFISYSYIKIKADPEISIIGAVSTSVISFFILAGVNLTDFSTDRTGPKSMFLAIITGLGASALYLVFEKLFKRGGKRVLSAGADKDFNKILSTLAPMAVVVILFALLNAAVTQIFDVDSFHRLLASFFEAMFSVGKTGYIKGFCFVLLSSVLWFFGIHGSDTLEGVMQKYFATGLEINQAAVASGGAPTQILTKEFFDCFVLMGGCGSAICLLIAILLFSRNRARRGLGFTAAFPMIFNINELMVFGLPIIFNPVMLIPFLVTPLVSYSTAYLALYAGWVPLITSNVEWTTPILIGGYHATGSVAGLILQLVNVIIGVCIYLPFVKILDRRSEESARSRFIEFTDYFIEHEQKLAAVRLTDRNDTYGDLAKELCAEIRHEMKNRLDIAYQPQYTYDGKCIGVEALMRWHHPVHGDIYPPLIVKLAEEGDFLASLEEAVVEKALSDRQDVLDKFGENVKLSINVTGVTITTHRFVEFCSQLNETYQINEKNICLEVTEQAALHLSDETEKNLRALRGMGFMLAIDDFSMGHTSIHYMKDNLFDAIKLDGSLVRGLFEHQNTREIISSVANLASSLHMQLIAEYVETEEQRQTLHELGCDCYQGYLYSPAVFLEEKTELK